MNSLPKIMNSSCKETLKMIYLYVFLFINEDLVKDRGFDAGKMVREAAKLIQGGGGGQPHFATAGGKNTDGLSAAVDKVVELAQLLSEI